MLGGIHREAVIRYLYWLETKSVIVFSTVFVSNMLVIYVCFNHKFCKCINIVKLRQGSGKDRQGMAVKAKGLKALTLA